MKILITGCTGYIGSAVTSRLVEAGFDAVGADLAKRADSPLPITIVELANREACYGLMDGVEAIVHIANIPSVGRADSQTTFAKNCAINVNVFQAAVECGVKKIIFFSSIQAVSGVRKNFHSGKCLFPYFPMDSYFPHNAGNIYSQSKIAGENLLHFMCEEFGLSGVSLRIPYTVVEDQVERLLYYIERKGPKGVRYNNLEEGFAMLRSEDLAKLIGACLDTDLPGYRAYMPLAEENIFGFNAREVYEAYYTDIPLKCPIDELKSLADNSFIESEVDWKPTPLGWRPPFTFQEVLEAKED